MSITFGVLGQAGRDNAPLVQIDSGQAVERLQFDCGDGCLSELLLGEVLAIDQLFFSHLRTDNVGGLDSFFRCTFNRDTKPARCMTYARRPVQKLCSGDWHAMGLVLDHAC